MRWIMGVGAVLLSFAAMWPAVLGGERGGAAVRPKQQCIIFCRQVFEDNNYRSGEIHSLDNGEKVCAWPGLEIAVKGIKQADGATVEVTLAPGAGARERHVVKFVKFDDTLVIPLGEKTAKGAAPRVEVLVGGGDVIHWNWSWNEDNHLDREAAEREQVFRAVGATGTARISCVRGSRLKERMGEEAYWNLWQGIDCVREYSEMAVDLYCSYCPHRRGLIDALSIPIVNEILSEWLRMNGSEYEEMVFGTVGECRVELIDGPWLMQNLESLGRLSEQSRVAVTIYTRKADDRLFQAARSLRIRQVSLSDADVTYFWSTCEEHAEKGASRDEHVKMLTVSWQVAEAAIPSFKKLPNLEEILILGAAEQEGEAKARETLRAVQKALPNAEAHLVFYGEKKRPEATAAKNGSIEKSRNGESSPTGKLAAER
jgi:hypothetical protein